MLNGQSVLTHQETFTERKPFIDTKGKEVKKKLTLFEIAQKNKKYLTNIKQLEIREKQNNPSYSYHLEVFLNFVFFCYLSLHTIYFDVNFTFFIEFYNKKTSYLCIQANF